jgi:hypothetical protein
MSTELKLLDHQILTRCILRGATRFTDPDYSPRDISIFVDLEIGRVDLAIKVVLA